MKISGNREQEEEATATTTTDSTFEDNYKMGEIARDWQNTASSEKKRKKPPQQNKNKLKASQLSEQKTERREQNIENRGEFWMNQVIVKKKCMTDQLTLQVSVCFYNLSCMRQEFGRETGR